MAKNNVSDLWVGMPDFIQESQEPYHMIKVRFADQDAVDAFAELIDQKITPRTRATWIPPKVRGENSSKRYYNEE